MRIAFITPSLSRKAGGLFHSVRRLAQSLQATPGTTVDVVALEDEFTKADLMAWEPLKPYHNAVFGPRALGYAPRLAATLRHLDPDITNANGLWTYSSIVGLRWSKRTRRPHVIAPRGMLDPWALNNSRWKKVLAERLYEGAHLDAAHCLHALNITEAKAFRAFGLPNPICIVPNGVDLPSGAATAAPPWQDAVPKGQRVLLYLGRIHLKKGLLNLVRAWQSVTPIAKREGWCLVIAGWDQNGHTNQFTTLLNELDIRESVHFVGPQFGMCKDATLRAAHAFILPSLSEGLPVAVLEAWSYGIPVLMTPECNLQEGFVAGAAIELQTETASIARALLSLFRMSAWERNDIGQRGQRLVKERFSCERIAAEMRAVYAWLLGAGSRPACVAMRGAGLPELAQ